MKDLYDIFRPTLILAGIVGLATFLFVMISFLLRPGDPKAGQAINYVDAVTLLLATVTVIFTIAAVALTVIGVWGFRSIKRDAIKYASEAADKEITKTINSALQPSGSFMKLLREEIQRDDSPFGQWLRNEIQRSVKEQIGPIRASLAIDEEDDRDEGVQT